jgi:tetratricopeptide (TPR) repeat protein
LREHTSEREKLAIAANYHKSVTGELDKAAQTFKEEIDSYPRITAAYSDFGGVFSSLGQYEKSAEITRQVVRLTPDWVDGYANLANYALASQRFDGAWDSGLIQHTRMGRQEYVAHLERLIADEHLTATGNPEDWANESHEYAQSGVVG